MNTNETEEQMSNRVYKMFNNMSDEEFKRLLKDAGFEFEKKVEEVNEERIEALSNLEVFELIKHLSDENKQIKAAYQDRVDDIDGLMKVFKLLRKTISNTDLSDQKKLSIVESTALGALSINEHGN